MTRPQPRDHVWAFWGVWLFALAAVGPGPSSVLAAEAFVTSQNSDTLTIVDLEDLRKIVTLEIGGKVAGVAVAPKGDLAYLTSPDGKFLTVIDADLRHIRKRIPLMGGPLGVAVHPSGSPVYVADWYEHRLFVVDPEEGVIRSILEVGKSPSGVAVTPDGKTILTADRDSNEVSVIDAGSLQRLQSIPVGERPFGVTIDAEGKRAYTANVASNDVSIIDLAAWKEIGRVKVGERPYAVALGRGKAFVTDQYAGTVSVFDTGTLAPLETIMVDAYPEGIEADREGRFVYVACWEDNTLVKIDAETLEVVGKLAEVGDGPRAFGAFLREMPK